MTPNEIAEEAIRRMNIKITDEIFLIIQNDRDLMQEYLRAVENNGLDKVNQIIGKKVKDFYELENGAIKNNPLCTLIQTYTTHLK